MSILKKSFIAAAVLATSMTASANIIYSNATVTFGGVASSYDNSALTSSLLQGVTAADLANTGLAGVNGSGVFVETFDQATQLGSALVGGPFGAGSTAFNSNTDTDILDTECAVNGTGSGVTATGDFEVRSESKGGVAVVGYPDNCFAYTPTEGGTSSGSLEIDFQPILDAAALVFGTPMEMDYVGFYWATIDQYNSFTFFNDGVEVLAIEGQDVKDSITTLQLGSSSQFVNVNFNAGETFDKVVVESTRRASEFDNIVNRIVPVSAPSTLAILALGIFGIRRLAKK